jgi:hypothetical protein
VIVIVEHRDVARAPVAMRAHLLVPEIEAREEVVRRDTQIELC